MKISVKSIYINPEGLWNIDYFVNPIPALSIAIMGINDHILKSMFSNYLTGKLSDFCGVFYFPLFLCASFTLIINSIRWFKKKPKFYLNSSLLLVTHIITIFLMISVKWDPNLNHLLVSLFNHYFFNVEIVPDRSDLISLSMIPFSYKYGCYFISQNR